jgi:hypothetical protein
MQGDDIGHHGGCYRLAGEKTWIVGQPHQSGEPDGYGAGRIGVALRIHENLVLMNWLQVDV